MKLWVINPMIYQKMAYPREHDVASQATNSIRCLRAKGPSIHWITLGLYSNYNCVPQYIWGYFLEMRNKSHWIQQRIYRLTVCNRRAWPRLSVPWLRWHLAVCGITAMNLNFVSIHELNSGRWRLVAFRPEVSYANNCNMTINLYRSN